MIKMMAAFVPAVIIAYFLAVVASTQSVLASLKGLGISVTLAQRIEAITHDLFGMAPLFLPLMAIAFLIAFLVAGLLIRWKPSWRPALYTVAGGAAVAGLHLILKSTFDITTIAGARTATGLFIQALAGTVGGYVFFRLV